MNVIIPEHLVGPDALSIPDTVLDCLKGPNRRCYVASGLGFTEMGRYAHARLLVPSVAKYFDPVDPWVVAKPWIELAERASKDELWDIMADMGTALYAVIDTCDLLAVCLDGVPGDEGACDETVHASHYTNIPCVGYRGDVRPYGDFGIGCNAMTASAIKTSGGRLTFSLEDFEKDLASWAERLG